MVSLFLVACSHQPKDQVVQTAKAEFGSTLKDVDPLRWRCPGPAYERFNPNDGTIDHYAKCFLDVGNITVIRQYGSIIPLGELASSEVVVPKTFNNDTLGNAYTSGPIKFVKYNVPHDSSKVRVGYEVTFPKCAFDAFTLYIKDQSEEGALEALDYVFDKMKVYSNCDV